MIKVPLNVGDTILVGKFKNKREEVKTVGTDINGQPTINGRKMFTFRIEKLMPKKESIIKFKDILNEGAWGQGPLDNDLASDWKWTFGKMIIKEIENKLIDNDLKYKYYAIGIWEDLKNKLKTQYTYFTNKQIVKMNELSKKAAKEILEQPDKMINHYDNPKKIKSYLINYIK